MSAVLEILREPAVITVLATISAIIVVYFAQKKPWIAKWTPLIISIYNIVEKEMEGKPGMEKLNLFMEKFQAEYEARTNKSLSKTEKDAVKDAVAVIAFKDKVA